MDQRIYLSVSTEVNARLCLSSQMNEEIHGPNARDTPTQREMIVLLGLTIGFELDIDLGCQSLCRKFRRRVRKTHPPHPKGCTVLDIHIDRLLWQ